jgi:site-specific DNA-cytosine methylase
MWGDCWRPGSEFIGLALSHAHPNIQVAFNAEGDMKEVRLFHAMHSLCGGGPTPMRFPDIKDRANAMAPPCDLFVSGASCHAWSSAGAQAGLDYRKRGGLMFYSLD